MTYICLCYPIYIGFCRKIQRTSIKLTEGKDNMGMYNLDDLILPQKIQKLYRKAI